MLELVDLGEGLTQAVREPLPVATRRDGNTSTKGHASREATALANVVLPVPGGPKRKIARGGLTPYSSARSGLTSGSRACRSSELLLVLHAGQGFPQSSGQHPAVELAQEPDVLGLQRHDAPEVRQSRVS
jgi:hypothetical protein